MRRLRKGWVSKDEERRARKVGDRWKIVDARAG